MTVARETFTTSGVAGTRIVADRIGDPEAPAVVFLASNESSWITGETLYISGGMR